MGAQFAADIPKIALAALRERRRACVRLADWQQESHERGRNPSGRPGRDIAPADVAGGDAWLYSFDPKGDGQGKSKVLWKFDANPKETKYILGGRGTGEVCLNGPAALRASVGDIVIVVSYAQMTLEEARGFRPTIIFPHERTNTLKP